MKRIKKIFILLFFILLFMPLTLVKAESYATCADVMDAITELDDIDAMYIELDCDNASGNSDIYKCNNLRIKKASVLEEIFEYNEENVCPSIDVSEIIDKYSGECSNRFSSEIKAYADSAMKLFFMAAPFIIIIFGSLDFFKIITSTDPKEVKKSRTNFIKRIVAFGLLYLTPFIVHFLFSLTPYSMDRTSFICSQELVLTPRTTVGEISGIYGGNNYGGRGQEIAEAAREIKKYAVEHGYTWKCSGLSISKIATSTNDSIGGLCCAELIGISLYKAGIYDESTAGKIQTASAPTATRNVVATGDFEAIWDPDDLQPGDILIYKKYTDLDGCGVATIEGKTYHVPHIDIYYGDGKKVTTGGDWSHELTTFSTDFFFTQGGYAKWLCGLRYKGK